MKKKLDYKLYRFKYRHGKNLPLRTPVDVSLELSSHCNMRCSYCYHADQTNLPFQLGKMDTAVAKKIIDQSAAMGVSSLKFNWKGESSIHPDYGTILEYAHDKQKFVDLIINSNFKFNTKRTDIFYGLSRVTKIKVSYDSFKKEVFENQRTGGDHDLTTANIDKFYNDYFNHEKQTLIIQAVTTVNNKDEDLEGEMRKRWPLADISIRDMVEGRNENNDEMEELAHNHRDVANRQSCIQAHVRIIFNWEGKAFPCCPDIKEELCLGDIRKQSLKEIFNGYEAKQLRKSLKDKTAFDKDPCKNCSSFESYKGYEIPQDS